MTESAKLMVIMRHHSKGFTLIEMLVVIGVFAMIIAVGGSLFFSMLRGSTKSRTMEIVRQNGDYAISVMERMIRNARSLQSSTGDSMTIVNPDGGVTTFRCCGTSPNYLIASESGSLCENRLTSNDVKVDNCSGVFTVTQGETGSKPSVVTISFGLSQVSTTATRPEEKVSTTFQTTVSLRNY